MRQLHPTIVRVWTVVGALSSLPLLVPPLIILLVADGHVVGWILLGVALAVLVLTAVVVPRWRYAHTRWGVDGGVLRVERGVVFRSQASVPVFRIQHIDLNQGPLDRWAGLQQLTVHTASPAADIDLPGIEADEAVALRADLLAQARAAVERYGVGEASDAV